MCRINGRVLFCGWSYIDLKIINYGSGDGQYAESGESREALVALGSSDSEYGHCIYEKLKIIK